MVNSKKGPMLKGGLMHTDLFLDIDSKDFDPL